MTGAPTNLTQLFYETVLAVDVPTVEGLENNGGDERMDQKEQSEDRSSGLVGSDLMRGT